MVTNPDLIFTPGWRHVYDRFIKEAYTNARGFKEAIGFSYSFDPRMDHCMSTNTSLFELRKAAAMYFWYKHADQSDLSIIEYFDEYKRCIDEKNNKFNSNYGYYAYTLGGLKSCIKKLADNPYTRHAMFCINNMYAMSDASIDKLCTNAIHFFIKNKMLFMVVQMRSSNFITLLPYDAFMFSVFYAHVYNGIRKKINDLVIGNIKMQVASLHFHANDICKIKQTEEIDGNIIGDMANNNWCIFLEDKLLKAIQK